MNFQKITLPIVLVFGLFCMPIMIVGNPLFMTGLYEVGGDIDKISEGHGTSDWFNPGNKEYMACLYLEYPDGSMAMSPFSYNGERAYSYSATHGEITIGPNSSLIPDFYEVSLKVYNPVKAVFVFCKMIIDLEHL